MAAPCHLAVFPELKRPSGGVVISVSRDLSEFKKLKRDAEAQSVSTGYSRRGIAHDFTNI